MIMNSIKDKNELPVYLIGTILLVVLIAIPISFVPILIWGSIGVVSLRPMFANIDKSKTEYSHHFFKWVLFYLAWPFTKKLRLNSQQKYRFMHIEANLETAMSAAAFFAVLFLFSGQGA